MTLEIGIVLAIIILTLYLFISEKYGVDTVSIIAMTLLMVTGILTPQEGFAGFNNYATITVACMFVLSAAIYKSGALNGVGNMLSRTGKKSYVMTLLILMIISGTLSAFMNDTAVVALFIPMVMQVCRSSKINPSKLLIPLSFCALMGGTCTLIGTSTNILVSGIATREGLAPIGLFEMAPAGLCFLVIGIIYMTFAGKYLLPDRMPGESVTEKFGMGNYLTEIILLPNAKTIGKAIKDSPLVKDTEVTMVQIERGGKTIMPYPDLVLEANDLLTVSCDLEKLRKLLDKEGIILKSEKGITEQDLLKSEIVLAEAIVNPNSHLEGKSVKEYNFRSRNEGATVLAIRHRDEIAHEKLGRRKLKAGDVLLISSNESQLTRLRKNDDLLIYSETAHHPFKLFKLISIIALVAGVVITATLGFAPIVLSATVGVVALIVFKFIEPQEAYKAVEWKVIFMLAGVLSLGTALEKTGAAKLLAEGILNIIGEYGPYAVLIAFLGITFLATNILSNDATAALLVPIAIAAAKDLHVNSRPLLLAVTFSASFSFMMPMGYQTNVMIYTPGNYKFKDFLKTGVPLTIIFWILASLLIPYFYPF